MDEEKIKRLQERIDALAAELHSSQEHLYSLQKELDILRKTEDAGQAIISTPKNTRVLQRVPVPAGLEHFIGLRLIHLVGIVVLVIGISIGVKYAIDKQLISESMRILLAYSAGFILLFLSYWLKKKYHLFSAILFSGSMASLYFTTYGEFVYYHFLPAPAAFVIMIALTVYTVIAAINYSRQEIAIFGMTGAYGIPFLISANAERVDLFFSYILLINIGVVFLSFKRSWKMIGHFAMFITWILLIGWAIVRYEPTQQTAAFIFIPAYYILFLFNSVAGAMNNRRALASLEIQQVLINNTAVYIALLAVLGSKELVPALSTASGIAFLFLGAMAFLSTLAFRKEIILQRLMAWQSLILLVLFIGFEWDGVIVTLLWLVVSLILFTWGIIKKRSWPRLAAVLLIGITLIKLVALDSQRFSTVQKIACFLGIGVLLLLFSFYYQKFNLLSINEADADPEKENKTGDKKITG